MSEEIPVPETLSDGSREIVRIFREPTGKLFFAVRTDVLLEQSADPAGFGIMLADLAAHIANCLEGRLGTEEHGLLPRDEIFDRIRRFAVAELTDPTDGVQRITS